MVADVTLGRTIEVSAPRLLLKGPYVSLGGGGPTSMSILPDGKRLLLMSQAGRLVVTTNWSTTVREQLRAKR
jgi:hypothetical protein